VIHVHFSEIEDPTALGLSFGQVVGNLRERFGRPDADRHRDAGVTSHRRPDRPGILHKSAPLEPGQVEKGLVEALSN
jgi:hypothetical protein